MISNQHIKWMSLSTIKSFNLPVPDLTPKPKQFRKVTWDDNRGWHAIDYSEEVGGTIVPINYWTERKEGPGE